MKVLVGRAGVSDTPVWALDIRLLDQGPRASQRTTRTRVHNVEWVCCPGLIRNLGPELSCDVGYSIEVLEASSLMFAPGVPQLERLPG